MTAFRELEYHLEIFTDSKDIKLKIDELLSAYEENFENSPRYQSGRWDGKKRFYETKLTNNGIFFKISKGFKDRLLDNIDFDDIQLLEEDKPDYLSFLKKVLPELPFVPYKHQLKAFIGMVTNNNHLAIIPTGGGKSLVAYLVLRYYWEQNKKIILIVPTIGLVSQFYEDSKDYLAPKDFLNDIQLIGGENKDKKLSKKIIISTWQSLSKSISEIKKYDVLLADEAHKLKASILTEIMKQPVKKKYGMTGSFPIIEIDGMYLIQALGEPFRYITAKKLMEMNLLTDTTIIAMFLNYSKNIVKGKSNIKYQEEVKFIRENIYRREFVKKLLTNLNGVTVALYNTTEHGENTFYDLTGVKLTNKLKSDFEMMKKHNVFFMSGNTKSSVREQIRIYLNNCEKAIVIGQMAVLSTGINIPRLKNLVFLSSTKSFTLVMQSIGRVMRLHKDKGDYVYVFDLVDVFPFKRENYMLRHFWQRYKYYQIEKHPIIEKEIELG